MTNLCTVEGCGRETRSATEKHCSRHRQQIQKHGRLTPEREKDIPALVSCIVKECRKTVRSRNLCRGHYEQARTGRPLAALILKSICVIEGCNKTAQAMGCCPTHYRQYREGETFRLADWGRSKTCAEPFCDRTAHSKGLCTKHYDQKFSNKSIARIGIRCSVCPETRGTQKAHTVPRREGGTITIPLCPTHHWCYDHDQLTEEELEKVVKAERKAHS